VPISEETIAKIREEEQKVRDFLPSKLSAGDLSAYSAGDVEDELHLKHLSSSEVVKLLDLLSQGTSGRDTVERIEGQGRRYYRARDEREG